MIIQKLKEEIAELQKKIDEIQELCSHPVTTVRNWNAGNDYDRQNDYRRDHHCQLCDKRWTTNQ
jgi:hypothetical protein